jgi:hypothetical protein
VDPARRARLGHLVLRQDGLDAPDYTASTRSGPRRWRKPGSTSTSSASGSKEKFRCQPVRRHHRRHLALQFAQSGGQADGATGAGGDLPAPADNLQLDQAWPKVALFVASRPDQAGRPARRGPEQQRHSNSNDIASGRSPVPPVKLLQVDDLLAMQGVTPACWNAAALRDRAAGATPVNVNTAPAEVLAAVMPNLSVSEANTLVVRAQAGALAMTSKFIRPSWEKAGRWRRIRWREERLVPGRTAASASTAPAGRRSADPARPGLQPAAARKWCGSASIKSKTKESETV